MAEAYIVDAVRTPVGKRGGGLCQVHPADLGAHSLKALVDRTGIDPGAVEDVVLRLRRHHRPPGRRHRPHRWLAAGLPEHVPGTTIDRQCGSSQQAVHFAAQAVMSRHPGPGRGRRRAEHVADPDHLGHARRPSSSASPTPSPARPAGSSATATRRSASSAAPR